MCVYHQEPIRKRKERPYSCRTATHYPQRVTNFPYMGIVCTTLSVSCRDTWIPLYGNVIASTARVVVLWSWTLLPFSYALLISCIIIIKQVSISKYKNLSHSLEVAIRVMMLLTILKVPQSSSNLVVIETDSTHNYITVSYSEQYNVCV